MIRTSIAIVAMLALLPASARADDPWSLCPVWPGQALEVGPDALLDPTEAPLRLSADFWESVRAGDAELSGSVVLQQGPRTLTADRLRHEQVGQTIRAEGSIAYSDAHINITSEQATLQMDPDLLRFGNLEYQLHSRRGRGSAGSLEASQDTPITLTDVRYTSCPESDEAWRLHAPSIELDTASGVGIARGVRVEFKGVPIFYSPWLSFPLDDRRKTGFLTPDISRARNTGTEARAPFYWNIAPNQDATITPRWMQQRGVQVATEYRYLFNSNRGVVNVEVLPDDKRTGDTRSMLRWAQLTDLPRDWSMEVNFNYASDPDYFEDLAGSLDATVVTHLRREATVFYRGNTHTVLGRLDGWQTLDRAIAPDDRPYARLPQLVWQMRHPIRQGGPVASMHSELVFFEAGRTRITGTRLDLEPSVSWVLSGAGWHLEPGLALRHTRYQLNDLVAPFTLDNPTRTVPEFGIDGGLVFEREISRHRIQTLEPRLLWLRVPFRDQSDFPLFDTSFPDFNMVQLFGRNRFNGADRIGDANQLAFGVASRIHAPDTGRDLLLMQVGRIRHFADRQVQLPGFPVETHEWSDILVEASTSLSERWSARVDLQLDPGSRRFERSLVQFRWHPDDERLLNVGWRFRRNQVDQADISFAWPLSDRWRAVGRWNWSIEDRRNLETFAGFEYQSCCWALRFVSRQYIANRAGDTNRSLYIQLELKGLASMGRGTEALLERGILGYSSRR